MAASQSQWVLVRGLLVEALQLLWARIYSALNLQDISMGRCGSNTEPQAQILNQLANSKQIDHHVSNVWNRDVLDPNIQQDHARLLAFQL